MKLLGKIEKTIDCWFVIATLFFFFLLRLPSLFEPYWYGDEGIYQVVAMGINNGRLLYQDIWDNRPPLLYMLYAFVSSDQFSIRLISLLFGLCTVFVFYLLARKLYSSQTHVRKIALVTTGIFAVIFGLPLLEGNIANSENFMLLPILLAGFLIFNTTTTQDKKNSFHLFIAGFLLGLAFLFKIVAVFDFAAFFLFLIFVTIERKINMQTLLPKLVPFCIAFTLPALATITFFLTKGAFFDFINAILIQMVGYVGYGNTLFIPQGFLIFKLMLLFGFCTVLFFKRHLFSKQHIFIFLWFAFSLFNAFFSGRPYTHYVLVLLPSLCLLFGVAITENLKRQKILFALIFVTVFLLNRNFSFYQNIIPYYTNYVSFMLNKKSVSSYQAFFDAKTPRDYALSGYINTHLKKDDNVFIWGNNGQLYTLINKLPPGRYIVAYHMTSSKETLEETRIVFEKKKPRYVVTSEKQPFPFSLAQYTERITIYGATIYERTL